MPVSFAALVGFGVFGSVLAGVFSLWALSDDGIEYEIREAEAATPSVMRLSDGTKLDSVIRQFAAPDDPTALEELQQLLQQAGYNGSRAFTALLAAQLFCCLALPLPVWFFFALEADARGLLAMIVTAILGYLMPLWFVRSRRSARQRRLRNAVPNMMDMLVASLEAGLGIDAALRFASREIGMSSPDLGKELDMANAEMNAGIPRIQALRRLDSRTGVDELTSLVNVIGQAERYGAGAAESIRAQAQLSRRRRALDAETRAANASPWLTVAMIIFILPALFVVLIGPTLVLVLDGMVPFMRGG